MEQPQQHSQELHKEEQLKVVSIEHYAGRLKYFYPTWAKLTDNPIILIWVQGYRLPFHKKPIQLKVPKPKHLSPVEKQQMQTQINKLLKSGAVEYCDPVPGQFISRIFLADKPNDAKRFILNLKELNQFVVTPHFKMEDIRTAVRLIRKDTFLATIDLKDAYYMLPIYRPHRKYLRFLFNGRLYQFTCLPFGLSSAPFTFTKLLKPVNEYLRSRNVTSVNYLDDFLMLGCSEEECSRNVELTTSLLRNLGFIVNATKSFLSPSTQCKFLGFLLNSQKLTLELPQEKRQRLLEWTSKLLSINRCTIKKFARYIGILTSACPATKYGWLYTKLLERAKFLALRDSYGNYNACINISSELIPDLRWWKDHIMTCENDLKTDNFCLEICTDASLSGWGAYCAGESTHGWWSEVDKSRHINYLELQAIYFGLKCFANNLCNCNILIRTDNTTALSYINRMGSVQHPDLNKLARTIWQWCEANRIYIFASYICSKNNWQADHSSRMLPAETEWSLNIEVYNSLVETFGIPEVDMFASLGNHKCARYISWLKDPEAEAVDAFTVPWGNCFFYAFPPFSLILRVLQKIINDKATGIVIVPFWQSQSWYPLFRKLIIDEPIFIGPQDNLLFCPYRQIPHPLAKKLILVATKLSGKLFA